MNELSVLVIMLGGIFVTLFVLASVVCFMRPERIERFEHPQNEDEHVFNNMVDMFEASQQRKGMK